MHQSERLFPEKDIALPENRLLARSETVMSRPRSHGIIIIAMTILSVYQFSLHRQEGKLSPPIPQMYRDSQEGLPVLLFLFHAGTGGIVEPSG